MIRWLRYLSWVLVGAMAVALGAYVQQQRASSGEAQNGLASVGASTAMLSVGLQRPEFSLPDTEGVTRDVREWDGRLLVINFWATWCTPCRTEIPGFVKLQTEFADQGLQFVGVAIDDQTAVKEFAEALAINYPLLVGQDQATAISRSYGNTLGVLPFTVIVDRGGRIAFVHRGELAYDDAQALISKLL